MDIQIFRQKRAGWNKICFLVQNKNALNGYDFSVLIAVNFMIMRQIMLFIFLLIWCQVSYCQKIGFKIQTSNLYHSYSTLTQEADGAQDIRNTKLTTSNGSLSIIWHRTKLSLWTRIGYADGLNRRISESIDANLSTGFTRSMNRVRLANLAIGTLKYCPLSPKIMVFYGGVLHGTLSKESSSLFQVFPDAQSPFSKSNKSEAVLPYYKTIGLGPQVGFNIQLYKRFSLGLDFEFLLRYERLNGKWDQFLERNIDNQVESLVVHNQINNNAIRTISAFSIFVAYNFSSKTKQQNVNR
jgi:hypothetical protein